MLSPLLMPDTSNYLIAGYAVFGVVIALYLLSISSRWKRARQDYQKFLAGMQEQDQ